MPRKLSHIPPDMTLSKAEIAADRAAWDALERDRDRWRGHYERAQRYWIEAAETAIQKGDFRPLQLRIDAARSGPVDFTET